METGSGDWATRRADAYWWFGCLAVIKLSGEQTGGQMSITEVVAPPGYKDVPWHVHREADEAYCILEGEMTLQVGDKTEVGGPGAVLYVPKGTRHRFWAAARSPLRYLITYSPAGFEGFIRVAGEPARAMEIPPPRPPGVVPDFATLNRIMSEEYATDSLA